MYTLLRRGDRLPTVAVLQTLLNRQIPDKKLAVDGIFGENTKKAVLDFQKPRGLKPDGIVGKKTWPRLITATNFKVIDAVDITDPDVLKTEGADIKEVGGRPIFTGAICNGIGEVVQRILMRSSSDGSLVLLRFFGHGASANMGISDGEGYIQDRRGRRTFLEDASRTSITNKNFSDAASTLGRLRFSFGVYSSVELHGCNVSRGVDGRQLMQRLAGLWGVPVSGGTQSQYGGGVCTFRFEGPVYTAFPAGHNLRSWSRSLLALPEMSIP
jgi:hypothetical protein